MRLMNNVTGSGAATDVPIRTPQEISAREAAREFENLPQNVINSFNSVKSRDHNIFEHACASADH
ncbi:hypothetical protein M3Y97_00124900 [Aphelenchoides bicaudatus]|nr:hypothetical protein M3Y97_00124900 [Aphelenchoides bicaudatus]